MKTMQHKTCLHKGRFLTTMSIGGWEYVERNSAGGAVVICAKTPYNEIIFVEQFRPPVQCNTIELPAGLVGDVLNYVEGPEGIIAAAKRELIEETGWDSNHIEIQLTGPSSPGLSSEEISFVTAEDLFLVGPGGGVGSENISVHRVHVDNVYPWIKQKIASGCKIGPQLFCGLSLVHGKWIQNFFQD